MKPDEQKLQELTRRIVEAVHPLKIVLFGSAARGEMGLNSDLDVLVVMPEGVHHRKMAQLIYRHLVGFGFTTDVVVATESDLRKYGDNFSLVYYPALREGREIYAV